MIKKIILGFALLFSMELMAQESTASPYSFYGIGDQRFRGTAETRSMGGLGILPDSIHMNLQNPATYSSLKRTTFAVGATYNSVKLKTNSASDNAQRTTLDYFAISIPMGKLNVSFGLIPYSAVGYRIQNLSQDGTTESRRYTGNGGVNRVFLGAGYEITEQLSVGADFQYNFGTIKTNRTIFKSEVQYGTRELNISNLGGSSVNVGVLYQAKFKNKYDIVGSLTFSPNSKLRSQNKRNVATIVYNANGIEVINDKRDVDVENTNLTLPSKIAFGAGIGEKIKWFVGAEVTLEQTSNLRNLYTGIVGSRYENGTKFSLGGYYTPNYASFSSYWNTVTYRGGLRFQKTGLFIRDQSINDYVISLGVGLPVGRNFSNINVGFEYGKRGTTSANLVQENYFSLIIGFSLSDKWFVKTKYD